MTTTRHIDDLLNELHALLLEMSDRVDEQLSGAINALVARDAELAQVIVRRDDIIDELEMKVDEQCERILALHQPVAIDLRMIIFAVKINVDLERIGDLSKNVAKAAPVIFKAPGLLDAVHIQEMADQSRDMLRLVHESFVSRDRLLARKVLARDRHVDRIYDENTAALLEYGRCHPEHLDAVAKMIITNRGLERISDHAKNIAESVVFLIEGLDIRHRRDPVSR